MWEHLTNGQHGYYDMAMLDTSKPRPWTLASAKNHLSEIVDAALDGKPQIIARRGDAPVVVIAQRDLPVAPLPSMLDILASCPAGELPIPARSTRHRENVNL